MSESSTNAERRVVVLLNVESPTNAEHNKAESSIVAQAEQWQRPLRVVPGDFLKVTWCKGVEAYSQPPGGNGEKVATHKVDTVFGPVVEVIYRLGFITVMHRAQYINVGKYWWVDGTSDDVEFMHNVSVLSQQERLQLRRHGGQAPNA